MSIPDGSSAELAFAVSPDDQQIAIAEINEQSDVANDTSKGYIEDLVSGGNQVSLWDNSGTYALRWPAGWDGSSLIDEVASGPSSADGPACGGNSYHVVDPSTGDATRRRLPDARHPSRRGGHPTRPSRATASRGCRRRRAPPALNTPRASTRTAMTAETTSLEFDQLERRVGHLHAGARTEYGGSRVQRLRAVARRIADGLHRPAPTTRSPW